MPLFSPMPFGLCPVSHLWHFIHGGFETYVNWSSSHIWLPLHCQCRFLQLCRSLMLSFCHNRIFSVFQPPSVWPWSACWRCAYLGRCPKLQGVWWVHTHDRHAPLLMALHLKHHLIWSAVTVLLCLHFTSSLCRRLKKPVYSALVRLKELFLIFSSMSWTLRQKLIWLSLKYIKADLYCLLTWCPKANCSSKENIGLFAAQLNMVPLSPWAVKTEDLSTPSVGSMNSLNQQLASAVDILAAIPVFRCSDRKDKKSSQSEHPACSLAKSHASAQLSSSSVWPRMVDGKSSFCCSLDLEELLLDVAASSRVRCSALDKSGDTTYIKSFNLVAVSKQNRKCSAMTWWCKISLCMGMSSSCGTSFTVCVQFFEPSWSEKPSAQLPETWDWAYRPLSVRWTQAKHYWTARPQRTVMELWSQRLNCASCKCIHKLHLPLDWRGSPSVRSAAKLEASTSHCISWRWSLMTLGR